MKKPSMLKPGKWKGRNLNRKIFFTARSLRSLISLTVTGQGGTTAGRVFFSARPCAEKDFVARRQIIGLVFVPALKLPDRLDGYDGGLVRSPEKEGMRQEG
jgi:hypothetical protein